MSLFGPDAKLILSSANATSIGCAGTATVYSKAFELAHFLAGALIYKFASDGSVNAKIELEQSDVVPTTEGASDANYVIPESASVIDTVTDKDRHIKAVSPVTTKYARLKITGIAGNDDSTALTAKLSVQEEI